MAVLVRMQGSQLGKWVYSVGRRCVLGRHLDCDIADIFADNSSVSRVHAEIEYVGRWYVLEDKGSRNGTYLNGRRVTERVPLRSGDRLMIGGVELKFLEEADAVSASAAPPPGPVLVSFAEPAGSAQPVSRRPVAAASSGVSFSGFSPERIRALVHMFQRLGRTLEIDATLHELLGGLFLIFRQAQSGFVAFTAEGHDDVVPRATHFRHEAPNQRVALSRTLVRYVLSQREAVLWVDQEPGPVTSGTLNEFGIRSLMCVPLVDGEGNAFGVVQIDTDQPVRAFSPEDLEVMVAAVSQAAVAVRFAKLHEDALRRQALGRDLELARRIQLGLLPEGYPQKNGYEFFAYYRAAYDVGGDYYDFIQLPNDRLALVLADAAGKGVSAALLMARLSGELKYRLSCEAPAVALGHLNEALCVGDTGQFVTLLVAILDRRSRALTLVNAGHAAPLLRRPDGSVEAVAESARGTALGLISGRQYAEATLTLEPGAVWLAYTDGLTESTNAAGETFGATRLRERLAESRGPVRQSGEHIIRETLAFLGEQPQSDDMCLLAWGLPDPNTPPASEIGPEPSDRTDLVP